MPDLDWLMSWLAANWHYPLSGSVLVFLLVAYWLGFRRGYQKGRDDFVASIREVITLASKDPLTITRPAIKEKDVHQPD